MNQTSTACCVALMLLTWAGRAGAQTAEDFAGDWKPTSQERPMLAELKIVQEGTRWTAHAYGSCTPTPCDWGVVPFVVLQQRPAGRSVGWAVWQRGTATRYVTMRLGEDALVVDIHNLFSGPRDQPSYFVTGELSKLPRPITGPPRK
jgi:hypothetical protein